MPKEKKIGRLEERFGWQPGDVTITRKADRKDINPSSEEPKQSDDKSGGKEDQRQADRDMAMKNKKNGEKNRDKSMEKKGNKKRESLIKAIDMLKEIIESMDE